MLKALTLAVAAAASPPVEPTDYRLPPGERSFRIVPGDCNRAAAGGEIVVCGGNSERHRLRDLPPPPGAERRDGAIGVDLPFGRVEPSLQTVVRPDGWVDRRIMVTVKIPF